jgi:ribosomal protein S18 acetylase RimI-like enzyme
MKTRAPVRSAVVVRKAGAGDAASISQVCLAGWRATYADLYTPAEIEATIAEWYSVERIAQELAVPANWNGWWVALDGETVGGAGGGAFQPPHSSELYVLYVDPARRGEGIGTTLLHAITSELVQQGAREQWVSVTPGNTKGIPFYEARGFTLHATQPTFGETLAPERQSLRYRRPLPERTEWRTSTHD